MHTPYSLATDKSALDHLDISSAELMQALIAELRAANERVRQVEEYVKTGRGGAATNASRQRLRREAKRRVVRAKITLTEASIQVSRLKRKTDQIPWAEVVA